MTNTSKILRITILAMLTALTVLLAAIPQLGFITIGPLSITILHIPVIIGALIYGPYGGLFMGTIFGVSSWIISQMRGGILDALFFNPMISIFPRVIFGIITGLLVITFLKPKISLKQFYLRVPIISFVASLIHSFLVLFMVFIITVNTSINPIKLISDFIVFFALFLGQATLEAVGAAIIILVISKVLKQISEVI